MMKIEHGYFKDAEQLKLKTNFIRIMSEDDRCLFEVRQVDGHTIEVSAGDMVKDNGVIYNDTMIIIPKAANVVVITKPEYK